MHGVAVMAAKNGNRTPVLSDPPANAEDAVERGLKVTSGFEMSGFCCVRDNAA
jgi:hypothetical protein